jgi:hypothetical protein
MSKYYIPDLDTTIKDLTVKFKPIIVNEKLPSLPTNILIYARSGQGKTCVIINLLNFYKKVFKNRIIVISKTRDQSLLSLEKKYGAIILHNLFNEAGENVIQNLIDHQQELKGNGEKLKPYICILEDWITDKTLNQKRNIYDTLFSQGRHSNITTIITSQQYTAIPAGIRRMAWVDIVFKISNQAEKKLMINELCSAVDLNENEFEKIYNNCVKEPHSFLYIDRGNAKWSKKFN